MGNNYMPSEIARLILGYLKEINCRKTSDAFLVECPHLKEYSECLRYGREYPTNIGGKSLRAILDHYYYLKEDHASQPSVRCTMQAKDIRPTNQTHNIGKKYEDRASSPISVAETSSASSVTSDKDKNEDDTWKSPRRKTHPLKRKINFSPLGTPRILVDQDEVVDEGNEGVDLSVVYEQMYQNTGLHELIAHKINEAVSISSNLQDEIVKEAVDKTQSDPLFEELLNNCCDILRTDDLQNDDCESANDQNSHNPSVVESNSQDVPAPCSVVEVTSSENRNEQVENVIESLTPQNLCFPSSSNHMILKTPSKNAQYLQVIISPGQPDWPTISNVNLMVNSPYHELLKQVENYQSLKDCVKKTRPVRARPIKQHLPEIQKAGLPNRVDCHVVRDLNFTRNESVESGKKKNDRSPQLKSLVNSIQNLKDSDPQRGNHVRVLEFDTPGKSDDQREKTPVTERTKEVANTLVSLSSTIAPHDTMSTVKINQKRKSTTKTCPTNKRAKKLVPDKNMLGQIDVENFLSKLHYIE